MSEHVTRRIQKVGLPPGTLVHIGQRRTEAVSIRMIEYDSESLEEKELASIEECVPYLDTPRPTWVDVVGLHEVEIVQKIGERYGFHPLMLEDVVNTEQRPKIEDYGKHVFIVLKMLHYDSGSRRFDPEQVSLVVGENFLISFQERQTDLFRAVLERLRTGKGRLRRMGVDYLAYALMDAVVDVYFLVQEAFGDRLDAIEEDLFTGSDPRRIRAALGEIHALKRQMIEIRKSIWPLRDVVASLFRGESKLVHLETRVYFRDVYDHTVQVIEMLDAYREMMTDVIDLHHSRANQRLSEVMKVLTMIATLFIPLTFVAGVYGMNFDNMPEIGWKYGYPVTLLAMLAMSGGMLAYFRKKGWL